MTTPIRPGFPPLTPPDRPSGAAIDAQRAFFQAAMQGTAAPARPAVVQAPVQASVRPTMSAAPPGAAATDEPQAVRPGRYLDIRV